MSEKISWEDAVKVGLVEKITVESTLPLGVKISHESGEFHFEVVDDMAWRYTKRFRLNKPKPEPVLGNKKRFDFLMSTRVKYTTVGNKTSEEVIKFARDLFCGKEVRFKCGNLKARARKLSDELRMVDAAIKSWLEESDIKERFVIMQGATSKKAINGMTVCAVESVIKSEQSLWEASKEFGVYVHSVKAAHAKYINFDKAAKEYQNLL